MAGYGYIRGRKQESETRGKPQVTSLADVTLVVMVIFLVTASAAVKMVDVGLPEGKNTQVRDMNVAVTVSISNQKPPAQKDAGTAAGADAAVKTVEVAAGPDAEKGKKEDQWLFYFEDDTTGIQERNLWTALKTIKGGGEWSLAVIRSDTNTPCENVSILIQCLLGLGVDEIALVMQSDEDKAKSNGGK